MFYGRKMALGLIDFVCVLAVSLCVWLYRQKVRKWIVFRIWSSIILGTGIVLVESSFWSTLGRLRIHRFSAYCVSSDILLSYNNYKFPPTLSSTIFVTSNFSPSISIFSSLIAISYSILQLDREFVIRLNRRLYRNSLIEGERRTQIDV